MWGSSFFGADAAASAMLPSPAFSGPSGREDITDQEDKDPHLRRLSAVTGYGIHANDGSIGHVEYLLLEGDAWSIRYLIVDTENWWLGKHVLISPYAVREISSSKQQVFLVISRDQVKSSPPGSPLELIDQAYERRLHRHNDGPGYGWCENVAL